MYVSTLLPLTLYPVETCRRMVADYQRKIETFDLDCYGASGRARRERWLALLKLSLAEWQDNLAYALAEIEA